jgi:hypothetical protein
VDLVFIYGPPGVGKLTVATELSRLTGYKLFDNHASIDWVRSVFDDDTATFWDVVNAIRLLIIENAARAGIDLIVTEALGRPKDDAGALGVWEAVQRAGGRVCPVHLTCAIEVLGSRVVAGERLARGKTADVEQLHAELRQADYFTPIPGRASLGIDNTEVAPEEAARRIVEHYGLRW